MEKMLLQRNLWVVMVLIIGVVFGVEGRPHRILLDTDVDTDDIFAILYLLKLNRSEFDLQAITINTNAWTNAGHAVNQVYDILYMMGRDEISVGVGGEGGIRRDGTILPNVGGYLPIIEQGLTTTGGCRYRQAIPKGRFGGILDIDSNYGFRKAFLPQGSRKYQPLNQPTAQQVMIDTIASGPITVFVIGAHTNFAIFLMDNPHLKKNVKHIYVMGGGVRSRNPTGCCPKNASSSCMPRQCGDHGNLFTGFTSNPYAELNFFGDPFAAYQVLHSGIPITLVPLDATNTIPVDEKFFDIFEQNQRTYEAQYCFKSLKMTRDTWFDDQFYTSYFMWDSFSLGIATSIMRHLHKNQHGENEFAEMQYMNITVVTSNKPHGISDGSNPFFDGLKIPKFNLKRGGVHSGHVQKSLRDPFCLVENGKGRCKDGFTKEETGPEGVRVLVATKAKPNQDAKSSLDKQFFVSFLDVLNSPEQSGRFNFTDEFPYYREVYYKPDLRRKKLGKNVVFDMDMSAGDFLALLFLLKVPVEVINLKAILVTPTGWANGATIDVIYDLLHMMGRDDIPVGLGDVFARNQSDPIFSAVGDCKYVKAIPQGSGGFLDSDTLYGFARHFPRSPRRYTAENSVKDGAPRDTDHPELRQPLALEVWDSVLETLDSGSKITILMNGPLTTLANVIHSRKNTTSLIQDVYIVGGHISNGGTLRGNAFSVPSNEHAELNMYLDPLASQTLFESDLDIKRIPLRAQHGEFDLESDLESNLEPDPLVNEPLTMLANNIVLSGKNTTSLIQDVCRVGGHISNGGTLKGNVFSVPSNEHAELNMYLDPLAAQTLFESDLDIKLIPLRAQHGVSSFPRILQKLFLTKKTPEVLFAYHLLSTLHQLQEKHYRYRHVHTFLGEILGAVVLADDHSCLNATFKSKPIKLFATGDESMDGQIAIDEKQGRIVKILRRVNPKEYYNLIADHLGDEKQSAVIASFEEQKRIWTTPP